MPEDEYVQVLKRALIGKWSGWGRGIYPTIDTFEYTEKLTFWDAKKPWLGVEQRTARREDGSPLHAESGYLRFVGGTSVEMVMAHPFGSVETYTGEAIYDAGQIEIGLVCRSVLSTPTARQIGATERRITVSGEKLQYRFYMAIDELPLQLHLEAWLDRAEE